MNASRINPVPSPVLSGLQSAVEVAKKIEEAGSQVIGSYCNGRRTVLLIDQPPAFVQGHCKQRYPNHLGGYTRMFAAPYYGVQLEWMVDEVGYVPAVGHA